MAELVQRHTLQARTIGDASNATTHRRLAQAIAVAVEQQRCRAVLAQLFKMVLTLRQISTQAARRQLRHTHLALAPRLVPVDQQRAVALVPRREVETHQLFTTQARAIQQRQHRHPQVAAVTAAPAGRGAPQRLHLGRLDPQRRLTLPVQLRPAHPAHGVLHPHLAAHEVLTHAAQDAQDPGHRGLLVKGAAPLQVLHDLVRADLFQLRPRPAPLRPHAKAPQLTGRPAIVAGARSRTAISSR